MFLEEHRKNIHVCELTTEVVRQLIPLLITILDQSSFQAFISPKLFCFGRYGRIATYTD